MKKRTALQTSGYKLTPKAMEKINAVEGIQRSHKTASVYASVQARSKNGNTVTQPKRLARPLSKAK
jgi:hypothetical protein